MSYVKTTWATGDVITAEKLNNMEGGISRFEVVNAVLNEDDNYEIQMSFADLKALTDAGKIVFVSFGSYDGTGLVLGVNETNNRIYVSAYITTSGGANPSITTFSAESVDDHPIEI